MCDGILCPTKASIKRFGKEGNVITSARDMRKALKEKPVNWRNYCHSEHRECRNQRIRGFSSFHFFLFWGHWCTSLEGVWFWQAYSLRGVANETAGSDVTWGKRGTNSNSNSTRVLKESESEEGSTYECPENGCLMSFNKLEDLDLPLGIGQHRHYTTGSVYHQLKVDWASKF